MAGDVNGSGIRDGGWWCERVAAAVASGPGPWVSWAPGNLPASCALPVLPLPPAVEQLTRPQLTTNHSPAAPGGEHTLRPTRAHPHSRAITPTHQEPCCSAGPASCVLTARSPSTDEARPPHVQEPTPTTCLGSSNKVRKFVWSSRSRHVCMRAGRNSRG